MTDSVRPWDALGLTSPFRRDCALAALVALLSATVLWLPDPTVTATGFVVLTLLAAQAIALCLRRVRPLVCIALVLVLQTVLSAVVPTGQGVRGPAVAIAVYTCGTLLTVRRSFALAAAAAGTEIAGYVLFSAVPATFGPAPVMQPSAVVARAAGQLLVALAAYGGAALIGQNVAMRRRYAELVELRAAEAARAQAARVESALAAERTRMARELHDVAAHHLTSVIVQAALVERLVERNPAAARTGAITVREEGRKALSNLRFIVGALREDGTNGAPAAGLAGIAELASGQGASLTVTGEPRDVPPAADMAFYRVAQEALSNARDHAPGAPVTITIRHRRDGTTLLVRNDPPAVVATPPNGDRRGFGLIGMRERATLIGATLTAGPAADGGWQVELTVPRAEGEPPP
jgi:signal transduction histidine kinase